MMQNFWKTDDIAKNFPEANNLEGVIDALCNWTQQRGRVVCSITVNGVRLNESEEKKFSKMPVREISEIKTESQTPEELLDESLIGCREHLKKLLEAYEKISFLFRQQDIHYAHRYHRYAIDSMQQFFEIVSHYRILYEATREALPIRWAELEKLVPAVLDQILAAYEKKDYNLVADLLEYDLLGLLEDWDKLINQICDNDKQNAEATYS